VRPPRRMHAQQRNDAVVQSAANVSGRARHGAPRFQERSFDMNAECTGEPRVERALHCGDCLTDGVRSSLIKVRLGIRFVAELAGAQADGTDRLEARVCH